MLELTWNTIHTYYKDSNNDKKRIITFKISYKIGPQDTFDHSSY